MWSFVGAKARPRWLWHALDHRTGRVLAYVVGARKDAEFLKLRALLAPLGIIHYYTDKADVYRRHLPPAQHTVGKLSMQKIERKHLTLRSRLKRLARKTLCFSRSRFMHDLLIGLYRKLLQELDESRQLHRAIAERRAELQSQLHSNQPPSPTPQDSTSLPEPVPAAELPTK